MDKTFCDKCKEETTNQKMTKVKIMKNLFSFENKEICYKCNLLLNEWFNTK